MESVKHDEKPQVKKRIRQRSIAMQLAIALKDAEVAATSKETDEYTIARMRLLQTRLKILSVKEARERNLKFKKIIAENQSLRTENERLRLELEAKPVMKLMPEIEIVLQRYSAEKAGRA